MYLLDTNIVSELRKTKQGRCNTHVLSWSKTVTPASLYISSISVMELELGILLLARHNPAQSQLIRIWFEQKVLPAFEGRILPIDTTVAKNCAKLHMPDRKPDRDALIAATALTHSMTVVTRNVADFEKTGVTLINPFNEML